MFSKENVDIVIRSVCNNELKINYDILFTQNVCNKKKSKMKDELYVE